MSKTRRFNRIHIAGPSGTGKTTLAKLLSGGLQIPYITTSAKVIWPKYDIIKHSESFELPISRFITYQGDINDRRITDLIGKTSFITDRSSLDSITYFLDNAAGRVSKVECDIFINEVLANMIISTDVIFFLPYDFDKQSLPENDGHRVTNRYYQEKSNVVFEYVIKMLSDKKLTENWKHTTLEEGKVHVFKLNTWDKYKKFEQASNIINGEIWRNLFI